MDALILAGGRARRLGGADKPALQVGGRTLLDRVVEACAACSRTIVVGPARRTERDVITLREDPPGGGPVAALAAGLPEVLDDVVALLAADLPFLTSAVLAELASRLVAGVDGALLVDPDGRDQLLSGVWRTDSLRTAVAAVGPPEGQALRRLLQRLTVVRVPVGSLPPGTAHAWRDCDTPEDLREAEELA